MYSTLIIHHDNVTVSEAERELHIQVVYQKFLITSTKHAGAARGPKKIECLSTCLKRKICTPRAHYHYPTWQEDTLYRI